MASRRSSKQRAAELSRRRATREAKRVQRLRDDTAAFRIGSKQPQGSLPVNPVLLAPDTSYGAPDFVSRGYYLDRAFECRDCGKPEVWTATQQKWWYEIAKGSVWTEARRCRPCRRHERERAAAHKRASEAGKERKARLKAQGK